MLWQQWLTFTLHLTLKVETAKVWSRISETTKGKLLERRIAPLKAMIPDIISNRKFDRKYRINISLSRPRNRHTGRTQLMDQLNLKVEMRKCTEDRAEWDLPFIHLDNVWIYLLPEHKRMPNGETVSWDTSNKNNGMWHSSNPMKRTAK